MLVNTPTTTANPPERGIKGLSFLFWSLTTNPILLKYLISQGVNANTTIKLITADVNGTIIPMHYPEINMFKNIPVPIMEMLDYQKILSNTIKTRLYRDFNIGKQLPWKLLVEISRVCNHKCLNCNIWESPKKEILPLKKYKELFEDNKQLTWLSLTGGEPFLRNDIVEIAAAAGEQCRDLKFLSIPTDGYRTDKKKKKAIEMSKMNFEMHLTISLDGPKEVHDKLRGKEGAYDAAIRTFNELRKNNIDVRYQATLHKQNLSVFRQFYLQHKKDIGVLTFTQTSDIYYDNDSKVKPLTGEEAASVFNFIEHNFSLREKQDIFEKMHIKIAQQYMKKKNMMLPCTAGFSGAFVAASGDVHPCFFMPSWGNIKQQSFKEIWFSKFADEERDRIKKRNCPKCWVNCFSFQDMLVYPEKAFARAYFKVHPPGY